eukprot:8646399-Pyramimonas_sp.AAC.1
MSTLCEQGAASGSGQGWDRGGQTQGQPWRVAHPSYAGRLHGRLLRARPSLSDAGSISPSRPRPAVGARSLLSHSVLGGELGGDMSRGGRS